MKKLMFVFFWCPVFVSSCLATSKLTSTERIVEIRYELATSIADKGLADINFDVFLSRADEFVKLCNDNEKSDNCDRNTVNALKNQVMFIRQVVELIKMRNQPKINGCCSADQKSGTVLDMDKLVEAKEYYPWELGCLVDELMSIKEAD